LSRQFECSEDPSVGVWSGEKIWLADFFLKSIYKNDTRLGKYQVNNTGLQRPDRMGLLWICIFFMRTKVVARLMYEDFGMDRYFAIQPIPVLRDQHILMVGDSLLRYQYVSLVHLLSKGEFPDKLDPDGKILQERMFPSWAEFFTSTNELFNNTVSGSEICDCHRDQVLRSFAEITENRYFRDRKNNFSITYIQYFGDTFPLHGNYRPRTGAKFHAAAGAGELLEASMWSYDTV
jgi:hypothetical protein